MVDGLQSSEHGSPTQTLEVILTDVEHRGPEKREISIVCLDQPEAKIVYLRSNLWKNCVMKMCISSTFVTSFLSTSLKYHHQKTMEAQVLQIKDTLNGD